MKALEIESELLSESSSMMTEIYLLLVRTKFLENFVRHKKKFSPAYKFP